MSTSVLIALTISSKVAFPSRVTTTSAFATLARVKLPVGFPGVTVNEYFASTAGSTSSSAPPANVPAVAFTPVSGTSTGSAASIFTLNVAVLPSTVTVTS